jgi:RNA polymerase sigma factor (sigma-70 family)
VVITRLYLDFRNAQFGRWRPSAAARRMGSWAVRLEWLAAREGRSIREAVETLRTSFADAPAEAQLRAMAARLPERRASGPSLPLHDGTLVAADSADDAVGANERARAREEITEALHDCLETLPAEDRLILQLRFWENLSVAEIARLLHLEQKPLYRRIAAGLAQLRSRLEAAGVSAAALGDWEIGAE